MSEIAITVKPTLSCNMRCKHCFNGEMLNSSTVINIDKVKLLFERASEEYEIIKITFHGGEPTLAGIEFYKILFDYQHLLSQKHHVRFRNLFTTNGLLLNEEFIDLLIENDVLINVSFDGPYNNILRQNGEKVLDNIKMIQKKCGRIRCYCTLSKESYNHLQEIYDWFVINKLDFKTLPIEKVGYAKENEKLIMNPNDLAKKFSDVYKHWIHDKTCNIRYYTFEEFSSLRRDMQFKGYWFNRKIALNPDGKIYPFGRPNDVNYSIGSPEQIDKIEDCFTAPQYLKLRSILKDFYETKCQNCFSLGVCNGVVICMSYMYEDDEDILSYSCNQANIIFQSILEINDMIISDFKSGIVDQYSDYIKEKFKTYQKEG